MCCHFCCPRGPDNVNHDDDDRRARRRPARDARFVYLDYSFSYVVSSLVPLVGMLLVPPAADGSGSDGEPSDGSMRPDWPLSSGLLALSAAVGGILLSIGNLSLQWATAVYGAPLTTVVAIQASLTVTIGTTVNYFLQPEKTARVKWLWMGVLAFLLAMMAATGAHLAYGRSEEERREMKRRARTLRRRRQLQLQHQHDPQEPDQQQGERNTVETFEDEAQNFDDDSSSISSDDSSISTDTAGGYNMLASPGIELKEAKRNVSYNSSLESIASNCHTTTNTIAGSGRNPPHRDQKDAHSSRNDYDDDIDIDEDPKAARAALALSRRTDRPRNPDGGESLTPTQTALILAVGGGCCFGIFSPAFNVAVNDPFGFTASTSSVGLSVAVANLWFSLAFTVASVCGTVRLMHSPPRLSGLAPTTLHDYITTRAPIFPDRLLGIAAGCLCGTANLLQFQGGRLVGFATADLVQAFPLVSTLWDIFLFGEYRLLRPSSRRTRAAAASSLRHDASSLPVVPSSSAASRHKIVTTYLVAMYILYLSAIACMMGSAAV